MIVRWKTQHNSFPGRLHCLYTYRSKLTSWARLICCVQFLLLNVGCACNVLDPEEYISYPVVDDYSVRNYVLHNHSSLRMPEGHGDGKDLMKSLDMIAIRFVYGDKVSIAGRYATTSGTDTPIHVVVAIPEGNVSNVPDYVSNAFPLGSTILIVYAKSDEWSVHTFLGARETAGDANLRVRVVTEDDSPYLCVESMSNYGEWTLFSKRPLGR